MRLGELGGILAMGSQIEEGSGMVATEVTELDLVV